MGSKARQPTGQSTIAARLYAAAKRSAPAPETVELLETHISWVLLTADYAYKIKKPVKLPFLDFSSLEARRAYCQEELRLNRRLAPALYLAVVPIGGSASEPLLDCEPAIEYAVKMRRFASAHRLDRCVTRPEARTALERFAGRLAQFHAHLPAATRAISVGTATSIAALATENIVELGACLDRAPAAAETIRELAEWTERQGAALATVFAARRAAGAVKEGHGDLHLENLAYIDGEVVAFDALEFAADFRWGDVASETAFLVMDLLAHGEPGLAFGFLDRYLGASGDYGAVEVLRWYLVYRALVRAKTAAIKARQHGATGASAAGAYLELAAKLAEPKPPQLVITHGLSGSGKTHVTSELLTRLPAVRVRSDIERKRLGGQRLDERRSSGIGEGLYTRSASRITYARLAECARAIIRGGYTAIVDAAFLEAVRRREFAALARELGVRFTILDCTAPSALLRARIKERGRRGEDASEATGTVLDHQLASFEPLEPRERAQALTVDTTGAPDYAALATALGARALETAAQ